MKCRYCGKEIDDDSVFCEHCGKRVEMFPEMITPPCQDDAEEQFKIGLECFFKKRNFVEAAQWLRKSAEQGYAKAQVCMGIMYFRGDGVEQNYVEGVKWCRKAAEQGETGAQYELGCAYQFGKGVDQNYAEAARWYQKAAAQGHAKAQNNLGNLYDSGDGVRQNYEEAVKWYRKAAEQGLDAAQYNLGRMYHYGRGVEQDSVKAEEWLRKSAEQGYAAAQFRLGVVYKKAKKYVEALKWLKKAAEQKDEWAMSELNQGRMASGFYVDVIMISAGKDKLAVTKQLKELSGLGLREAMLLVDACPTTVKTELSDIESKAWKELLERAGAKIELKEYTMCLS